MEEGERRSESEPGVQTESLSLILSAEGDEEEEEEEEEATLPHCASEQLSADEDDLSNGHIRDDGHVSLNTSVQSSGTSYWSVSESPDSPFLLSPVPGPSRRRLSPGKPERASRAGVSRIPGRDHRRYYHEHWRNEYLMDFDPRRNGMICMVCGSSLATLKLSTIKRHIRQKHPDSLLWSAADKEVIRSGWESHLSLENSQGTLLEPEVSSETEEKPECDNHSAHKPSAATPVKSQSEAEVSTVPSSSAQEAPSLPTEMLERYVNDSLHAWFRQEFLMEYQAEAGRLVCMVCSCPLPSLHLDHIKSHVLEQHPNSLVYSAEEKHRILQSWALSHESDSVSDFIKSEPDTKDVTMNSPVRGSPSGSDSLQHSAESYRGLEASTPSQHPPKIRLKSSFPWHLRLDYLVAIGPPGMPGCYCMVCSEQLPLAKVGTFRRHIQDCHPETTNLSQKEREDIASAWTQMANNEEPEIHSEQGDSEGVSSAVPIQTLPGKPTKLSGIKKEDGEKTRTMPLALNIGRVNHYPGKDQRRNYQLRWRMDFLMDYDPRRHGLICIVCGATLATLKVSTIKRHIQQVHPHSLDYNEEEKLQALQSYSQAALSFVHTDDCFSGSDHSQTAMADVEAVDQPDQYST
ncbi:zinc finger translocation-associated protein isoform X1 [Trichomycterus rosablanca]|uniref:zinc finger translocation-associated protein isoform X1 n=1 Tax=Trichomycterus rosablanca TaxID=2290929 RepID=UPI002F35DB42